MKEKKDVKEAPAAGVHAVRAWAGKRGADSRWGKRREKTVTVKVYEKDADELAAMGGTRADALRRVLEDRKRPSRQ